MKCVHSLVNVAPLYANLETGTSAHLSHGVDQLCGALLGHVSYGTVHVLLCNSCVLSSDRL